MTKLDTLKDLKVPGAKNDAGKLRFDLLDDAADEALVAVLTLGAAKYTPGGWRHVEDASARYLSALRRHLRGWRKFLVTKDPKDAHDDETGFPHIAQALCNVHFLCALYLAEHEPDFDGEHAARKAIGLWQARRVDDGMTIQQTFKDADPNRIAVVFQSELREHAKRRGREHLPDSYDNSAIPLAVTGSKRKSKKSVARVRKRR